MLGYNVTRTSDTWWLYSKNMRVQLRIDHEVSFVFIKLGHLSISWK